MMAISAIAAAAENAMLEGRLEVKVEVYDDSPPPIILFPSPVSWWWSDERTKQKYARKKTRGKEKKAGAKKALSEEAAAAAAISSLAAAATVSSSSNFIVVVIVTVVGDRTRMHYCAKRCVPAPSSTTSMTSLPSSIQMKDNIGWISGATFSRTRGEERRGQASIPFLTDFIHKIQKNATFLVVTFEDGEEIVQVFWRTIIAPSLKAAWNKAFRLNFWWFHCLRTSQTWSLFSDI